MIFEGTKNQFFFGLELTRAGTSSPGIDVLANICKIFDVSADTMMFGIYWMK